LVREFEAFADSILHGKPVMTDAREGAKTVEVCLSIIESSKTGQPAHPDYLKLINVFRDERRPSAKDGRRFMGKR
jgi:hypothetical protein